ncbi:hypothetical protein F0562_006260 [Nyssa sinensis]|uniref:Uncharacterized protein n=1 Tax=Nyssa sinensis TaxID=561372 RepID=A0A5J5ARA0_9ASTE|nr:hypothetical protein F0562_006260 [Nyssa sinensis]
MKLPHMCIEMTHQFYGFEILVADELEGNSSSSSGDGEGECGPQKLTRAQRKRLRKKKLKEEASRRRKVIGPLLPTASDDGKGDDGNNDIKNEPQGVCSNATEESDAISDKPGEAAACTNWNKLKHRRIGKRLARERSKPSVMENCHRDAGPCNDNERLA